MAENRFCSTVIYDALVDDEAFEALPRLIGERFGARSVLLMWQDEPRRTQMLAHSGYYSDEDLAVYASDFAVHDPWLLASDGQEPNRAVNLERLVSADAYEQTFFYNEFVRPRGDDTVRGMGVRTANHFGTGLVALHRGKQQEAYLDEEVDILDGQSKHFRRMLTVRSQLARLRRRSATLEGVLDSMRDAAVILRPDGRIDYGNSAAEAMLGQKDRLRLERGRLHAAGDAADERLRDAVALACHPIEPGAGAVLLERTSGPPVVATVTPLRLPDGRRRALLLAQSGDTCGQSMAQQLRQLFGLTHSEAEVAVRIGEGSTVQEMADERQVRPDTVRSQLKALMAKLGCRRQSEVVALIKAIPLPPAMTE